MIDQKTLKEYLNYNPDTGAFTWIKRPHKRSAIKPGDTAGTTKGEKDGYWRIQIFRVNYRAHRLAFLWMTGKFPEHVTDHKNGIHGDNRWENLREATHSQNCKNIKDLKREKSPYKGIYRTGKWWVARAMHNKKWHYLGCFRTPEEASNAYQSFAKEVHQEFYSNR